ncbi:MAG: FkbM family methyltransferase [Solirubrobacteraceae bacterium]|jgi:FkbM family methyltransferase
MGLVRRGVGWLSRRLERPELLAAAYASAREELHEEIAIRAILASGLRSDSTYVDVGTNRGQVLGEAVRVAPRGRHIAFEPIPALAVEVARAFPAVDCRRKAVGARPGEAEFCYFRAMDGWSGLRRSPVVSDERGDPEYITVEVSTLDVELGELSPAVIKIDVEGAELDVLEGARALLTRAKPLLIFEHVAAASALYDAPPAAPWDLLAELGYEVLTVTGDGPVTRAAFAENATVVNWLARPGAAAPG